MSDSDYIILEISPINVMATLSWLYSTIPRNSWHFYYGEDNLHRVEFKHREDAIAYRLRFNDF